MFHTTRVNKRLRQSRHDGSTLSRRQSGVNQPTDRLVASCQVCVCVCVINKPGALSSCRHNTGGRKRREVIVFHLSVEKHLSFMLSPLGPVCPRGSLSQQDKPHLLATPAPFKDNGMNPAPPVSVLSKLYGGDVPFILTGLIYGSYCGAVALTVLDAEAHRVLFDLIPILHEPGSVNLPPR